MVIKRNCLVCGKEIKIRLNKDRTYSGGDYFGKIKLPIGKGKYIKIDKLNLFNNKADVVRWNGKEKEIEYWECNKCSKE